MTISNVTQALVSRLSHINTPESRDLISKLQRGSVSEQEFISQANRFLQLTRTDATGAFNRAAARFAPSLRGVSLQDSLYKKIFNSGERGARVMAVEEGIRNGLINPMEVLNA